MDAVGLTDLRHETGHRTDTDRPAIDDLFPLVYRELRALARRQIGSLNPGETLSPTALVHEVYVRLSDRVSNGLTSEQHLRALAARVMRQLIVDYIRHRTAQKRGAGIAQDELPSDIAITIGPSTEEVLAIDEALVQLAALDARQAEIVEFRFFGGLTIEEIATTTKLSERTVKREWQKARAFLYDVLHAG
jgi:RNA polymerase sigma factor (TIGR02999 family)